MTDSIANIVDADLLFVTGSNTTEAHPIIGLEMKRAVRQRGARLILLDPREIELAGFATLHLRHRPGTDVAVLNALAHVIIRDNLANLNFIEERTEGFDAFAAAVSDWTPERAEAISGVPAQDIVDAAYLYAHARNAMIFWAMGITQHTTGTDNVKACSNLALLAGHIGRPATGLNPLRGQNNVQGASDAGLIPMVFPDYRRVGDDGARSMFERAWGAALDPNPGLTVVEITRAIDAGTIRGLYVMGENPAMSDPDAGHARGALAKLEHLVVQDIFPTETAGYADVILPASSFFEKAGTFTNTDRLVQLASPVVSPPGDARLDLWIIQELARRLGLDWRYEGPHAGVATVYEEMRALMPSIAGISWARLERERSVTYPCPSETDPGHPVVFIDRFPTADGRGRLVGVRPSPAAELPDAEYPLVLITGRELEHWHTGAITRRSETLIRLAPGATVSMHPATLGKLGIEPGDRVRVDSRRGGIALPARVDSRVPDGAVFIPFYDGRAAANLLTIAEIDPTGKIPEFKFCAVRVAAEV